MQIEIEKDTSKKVNEASRLLGVEKSEIIERAILIYLDNLSKYLDFKHEMKAWDALSDEALIKFEKLKNRGAI